MSCTVKVSLDPSGVAFRVRVPFDGALVSVKTRSTSASSTSVAPRSLVESTAVAPSSTVRPLFVRTGASFTAVTVIENVPGSGVDTPSESVKSKLSPVVCESSCP